MGFGFPAGIGAQVAFPDALVIDIAGDGSIQMNIQELATAVQYGLPVKVVILNNRFLGMVRQWQELFYEKRYTWTHMQYAPDFVKVAEAYGAAGYRIEKEEDVDRRSRRPSGTRGPPSSTCSSIPKNLSIPWCRQGRLFGKCFSSRRVV